jgi:hypothetical protein
VLFYFNSIDSISRSEENNHLLPAAVVVLDRIGRFNRAMGKSFVERATHFAIRSLRLLYFHSPVIAKVTLLIFYLFLFVVIQLIRFFDRFWLPIIIDGPAGYPFYLSTLAVVKNEAPYIAEWLEYHLLVGFEHFWLIDNDSDDNITNALQPYIAAGIVSFSAWGGMNQQRPAYNSMLPTVRASSYWVAIFDIDEFIVPLKARSIVETLRKLEGSPGVTINWVMYGANGKEKQETGLVIERFRSHTAWDFEKNRHTKTIVNPRMVERAHLHEHFYWYNLTSKNVIGKWNVDPMFDRKAVYKVLRMNHYWTKSVEEFRKKRARGAGNGLYEGKVEMYLAHLRGDVDSMRDVVVNDTAIDWAVPLVKANIAKRFPHSET